MRSYFSPAFWQPLQSRERALMYGAQFLGSLGLGFVGVFTAIDVLRFGMDGMMAYFLARFGIAGFLLFPLFTWAYYRWPRRRFFGFVLFSELLALAPLLHPAILQHPLMIGTCLACAGTGYWQVFHLAMAAHTSDKSRGYEVSLSQICQTFGGIAGYLAAGAAAALQMSTEIALAGFAVQIAASLLLFLTIPLPQRDGAPAAMGQVRATRLRDEIMHDPRRTVLTLLDAVYATLVDILMPSWLKLLGVAALSVGVVMSLRTGIQVLLAPLAGRLYAADSKAEIRIGSMAGLVGWLPWCLSQQTGILFFSVPLWAGGSILCSTGIQGRWYRNRSATAILTRELLLTAARMIGAWAIIPAMFFHPAIYAWLAAGVALAVFVVGGGRRGKN